MSYPDSRSPILQSTDTLTTGDARCKNCPSIITRISLIILGHTALVFIWLGALMYFPEFGLNRPDDARTRKTLVARATELGNLVAGGASRGAIEAHLANIAANDKSLISCGAYALDSGVIRPVLRFHFPKNDALGAAQISLPHSWTENETLWRAEISHDRGVVTHFLIRPLAETNRMLVYVARTAYTPGTWNNPRLFYAVFVLFLVSGLIALVITMTLERFLSRPLERLRQAFRRLGEDPDDGTLALYEATQYDPLMEDLFVGFNDMGKALRRRRDELVSSHHALEDSNRSLVEAKNFLESAMDTSTDGMVVSDLSGEITLLNRPGRRLFGYADTDTLPTQMADLELAPDAPYNDMSDRWNGAMRAGERLLHRKDGSTFPAFVSVAPLDSSAGSTRGYLHVIRDISESESYKEMIIHLDRLSIRGDMAGDIAHEINNYLSIILGNLDLATSALQKSDAAKVGAKMEIIRSTANRIATFAEGLMSLQSTELSFARESLNQLIHNLVVFLEPQNRLDRMTIDLRLDHGLLAVEMDTGLMQQFLVNMIYNAADALKQVDRKGIITITTERQGDDRARIIIADDGPGIPDTYRDGLFKERFTTKRKGHGIGLVTCAKIIQAHHGDILYTGSTESGARFEATLPLRQPSQSPSPATTPASAATI